MNNPRAIEIEGCILAVLMFIGFEVLGFAFWRFLIGLVAGHVLPYTLDAIAVAIVIALNVLALFRTK